MSCFSHKFSTHLVKRIISTISYHCETPTISTFTDVCVRATNLNYVKYINFFRLILCKPVFTFLMVLILIPESKQRCTFYKGLFIWRWCIVWNVFRLFVQFWYDTVANAKVKKKLFNSFHVFILNLNCWRFIFRGNSENVFIEKWPTPETESITFFATDLLYFSPSILAYWNSITFWVKVPVLSEKT